MDKHSRSLVRLALAIHGHNSEQASEAPNFWLPTASWQQVDRLVGIAQRASEHGWHRAADRLRRNLELPLSTLQQDLASVAANLNKPSEEYVIASVRDIYRDLLALHDEFDEVSWDLRQKTLSVTTDTIVLDEINLGQFEIKLEWDRLQEEDPYRVIALDPNPAAANSSISHPHVQDEFPCEGEARAPIRRALQQYRIADFFLIVANLLKTYNSSSPFVPLDRWHGAECQDCGFADDADDFWSCERCEGLVCGECRVLCTKCDVANCSECNVRCNGCDEDYCQSCLGECVGCDEGFCGDCLENERCKKCHAENETEENAAGTQAGQCVG